MSEQVSSDQVAPDPRQLIRALAPYRVSSNTRSLVELAITFIPFVLLWALMWAALDAGYWAGFLLTIPAAGFLVRLFMIQHDCGHGSFFRNRRANDWVGRIIGVLTLTPYDFWRRSHALHHANSGNLDHRGIGDIDTLTVREYEARTPLRRLYYRLYRHPFVMFGIGPAYLFVFSHRLPTGSMNSDRRVLISAMTTNASIALLAGAVMWFGGAATFLMVQVPITLLAASIGVWLFYVQHQFEETFWEHDENWRFHDAALHGSSYYELPGILRWFTANIGVHHVHHLSSRIPYYRLPDVMRDHAELRSIGRLTMMESFRCVRLVLWDEDERRLVSFREAHARSDPKNHTSVKPETA
ncbi:fatty acid desaturase [Fodinicurvata sp. EGI_FJ10296]|uniref:fatty acid desaturase n=1 Tax=Fodinicurvata sp. EGI_FJ10296 TaxID=3231908 RepID=UPI00345296C8